MTLDPDGRLDRDPQRDSRIVQVPQATLRARDDVSPAVLPPAARDAEQHDEREDEDPLHAGRLAPSFAGKGMSEAVPNLSA